MDITLDELKIIANDKGFNIHLLVKGLSINLPVISNQRCKRNLFQRWNCFKQNFS
jgi:hypothetical protein